MSIDSAIVFPLMKSDPAIFPKNWQNLSNYLNEKPGRQLNLTTYYTPQEAQKLTNPQKLAEQRAARLMSILQIQGISSDQIKISTAIRKDAATYEDNCHNCWAMSIEKKQLVSNEDAIKLLASPTVVYFGKSQTKFEADSNTLASLQLVAHYLQQESKKKAIINAHTDEEGGEQNNMELSQRRAQAVRAGLEQMKTPADQIELAPKGQKIPKCLEQTSECFRQNRRAEIQITD